MKLAFYWGSETDKYVRVAGPGKCQVENEAGWWDRDMNKVREPCVDISCEHCLCRGNNLYLSHLVPFKFGDLFAQHLFLKYTFIFIAL